ncbi:MAG: hypothetical protein JWN49_191 [Parcubacteria group bacterium]|nr:hypothetical protein [Parcubacteria group bacterium]
MKTNTIETNLEPTLYDVIDIMNIGFGRLDGLVGRFDSLEGRFDKLEEKMEGGFARVEIEIRELGDRVGSLETRVTTLALKVDGVDERLEIMAHAFDIETVKIIDHEKRIKKLERVRFAT